MKNLHTKPALILVLLFLAALLLGACGEENAPAAAETTAADASADTASAVTAAAETNRSEIKDGLPELDFDGQEIRILFRGGMNEGEWFVESETGDVVGDAVYRRNSDVMERLNVSFVLTPSGTANAQALPGSVTSAILAGSDEYDVIAWAQYVVLPLSIDGMFTNLIDAPYIDTDAPWWNTAYMDAISIGNSSRFFLVGDVTLTALKNTSAAFFNKNLFESYIGSPDGFYQDVADGKWTVDLLREYAEKAYADLNGNNKADDGDLFGIAATNCANTEHYAIACGMEFSKRDADGIPALAVNTERNVRAAEKIYDLYYNTVGMNLLTDDKSFTTDSLAKVFAADQLLFMTIWVQTADNLRDMESDYGIIPYPKLDEAQEQYRTLIHDTASMVTIPATCTRADTVCAVLEALSAESYRTVTPAYYEVALKTKYARDNISIQMIDLLHSQATTDFAYAYNYALNDVGILMRTVIKDGNKDFVSLYAAREQAALVKLGDLITLYMENTRS